jgi:hypothetical protein
MRYWQKLQTFGRAANLDPVIGQVPQGDIRPISTYPATRFTRWKELAPQLIHIEQCSGLISVIMRLSWARAAAIQWSEFQKDLLDNEIHSEYFAIVGN